MIEEPTHDVLVGVDESEIDETQLADVEVVEVDVVEDSLSTADPRVDDAVARLAELRDLPTADHVAVYEDIHSRLHDALADLGDPAVPPSG